MKVWLNGSYMDASAATVSIDDRGFLFADGIYEVVRVYNGRPFMMEPHMRRMRDGLAALRIDAADACEIPNIAQRLLADNGVTGDGTIYIQITRGAAPRKHAFPKNAKPTVYVIAKPFTVHPPEYFTEGVGAITVPDTRWARCDVKSISLLPNVMANNAAHEADCFEALFVKDGVIIEGSHSNLFGVMDNTLVTYPSCNYILSGISREIVLRLAREMGIPTREGGLYAERRKEIQELFLSGTTTEVMPVTKLNGVKIGDGTPGPITSRLRDAFTKFTQTAAQ